MKYNSAEDYLNIISTIEIPDTTNQYNQRRIWQYLKVKCPHCAQEGWVDNGDIEDLTKSDIESVKCNSCQKAFFLTYMDEWGNNGEFGDEPANMECKDDFPKLKAFLEE